MDLSVLANIPQGSPWDRYSHKKLASIWYSKELVSLYLWAHEVLVAVTKAQENLGIVREGATDAVARVVPNLDRILQIQEAGQNHMLRCYLQMAQEEMRKNGDEAFLSDFYVKLTSFDLEDTAKSLMLVASADILIEDLQVLALELKKLAIQHKLTVMMGRSHGIQGKPITFGKKVLDWLDPIERQLANLQEARRQVAVGKISGPMGIYSQDPEVECLACAELGLQPARVSTQILFRDYYADFMHKLVLVFGSLEFIATSIRLGQKTEVGELQEPFRSTGSSTMVHKRNPEISERIKGLSRIVRSLQHAIDEDMDTWDERDISQSSTERLAMGSMLVLTGYAIVTMTDIIRGLKVFDDKMLANINLTNGAIWGEDVKDALQEKGLSQNEAYNLAQGPAYDAYAGKGNIIENCLAVPEIASLLSREELEELCDPSREATRYIEEIFTRFDFRAVEEDVAASTTG